MSIKVQSYSLELKAQAVRMAMEDGLGIKETGKRLSWYPLFGQVEASFKLGFSPISQALAGELRATLSRCRGCKHRDNADYQAAFSSRPK